MSNELNVFAAASKPEAQTASAATAMMLSRQAQEVQAAMIVAKNFPRDPREANDRILTACTRKSLAESAMYSFPRGGQEITGPSIRLAEAIAQNWGNIDFGIIELDQNTKESTVMSYAWDLETNTRQSKVFTVPHVRRSGGKNVQLTDPRDIYEAVANQGARRLRSCILAVIPGDVVESAIRQCELTLNGGSEPLESRINAMVERYAEYKISAEMLAGFIGKRIEAFTAQDVVRLAKIYRSIKDGVVGCDYFFEKFHEAAPESAPAALPDSAPVAQIEAPAESVADPAQQQGAPAQVSLDDL